MSIILRWYTDGEPDYTVPYPVLTDDEDGEVVEFATVEEAEAFAGTWSLDGGENTSGWRAVPRDAAH